MRGETTKQAAMLLGVTTDELVPKDHPIRRIRAIVERVLAELSPQLEAMYAKHGRPSIPPEHLLKATLLMALYSIRSERQFCERLQYDLLFKWFLDLNIGDRAFHPTTFTQNRERLLGQDIATAFLGQVVREAHRRRLVSEDHFTVDGTLLESWASLKSYRPRDDQEPPTGAGRNPDVDFHGQKRSRDTHMSVTDPEALLYKKGGQAAKLYFIGHALMEDRHGLVTDIVLTPATGTAECEAALVLLDRRPFARKRVTLGADRGYDRKGFIEACRERQVTPHVAQNVSRRRSAIDGRTTHHPGYAQSLRQRKRVEEIFGWAKTVAGGRKLRYIGLRKNQMWATFTAAAYNLVRMANIEAANA
jgi:transposase